MSSAPRKSAGGAATSSTPRGRAGRSGTRATPKRARSKSLTELDRMNIRAERQRQLEAQQQKKKQREKSPMRRKPTSTNNKRESSPMPPKRVSSPMPRKRESSPMPPTRKRQLSPMRTSTAATTPSSLGGLNLSNLLGGMGSNSDNAKFEFAIKRCIPSEFVLIASQDDNNQAQEDFFAMEHFKLGKHVPKHVMKSNAGSVATTALLQIMYENPQRFVADKPGGGKAINVLELSREMKTRAKQCTKLDLRPTISSSRPLGPPRLGQEEGDEPYAPFYIVPPKYTTGVRRALLIGVITGQGDDLKGPPNDIANIQQFLIHHCGFKRDNITVLQDFYPGAASLKPTKTNILNGFTKLVRASKPNDVCFIQFTGHGGRMGNQLYICPSDYQKAGQVSDEMILKDLIKAMPKDVYTTMLVDCCYSGTVGDLPYVLQHNRTKQQIDPYYDLDMRREMIAKEKQYGEEYKEYKRQRAEKRIENRINLTEVAQAMATAATDVVVGTGKLGYDVVVGTGKAGAAAAEAVGNSVGSGAARISAAANMAAQAASATAAATAATAATAGAGLRRAMTIDPDAPPKQRSSDATATVGRLRGRSPMGPRRTGTRSTPRRARSRSLTEIDRMQIAQERLKAKNNADQDPADQSSPTSTPAAAPFGRSWTKGILSSSTTANAAAAGGDGNDGAATTGGRISRKDRKRIASKSPIRNSGGGGNVRVSRRNRTAGGGGIFSSVSGGSGDENNDGGEQQQHMLSTLMRVGTAAGDAFKRTATSGQTRTSTGKAAKAEKAARQEAIERSKREAMEARQQLLSSGGGLVEPDDTTTTSNQQRASTGTMPLNRSTTNPVKATKKGFFGVGSTDASSNDDCVPPKRISAPIQLGFGRSATTSNAAAPKQKTGFFGVGGGSTTNDTTAEDAPPKRISAPVQFSFGRSATTSNAGAPKQKTTGFFGVTGSNTKKSKEIETDKASGCAPRRNTVLLMKMAMEAEEAERKEALERSKQQAAEEREQARISATSQSSSNSAARASRKSVINLAMAFENNYNTDMDMSASNEDFVPGFRGTRRMTAINRMLEEDAELEAQQQQQQQPPADGDFVPGFRGTRRMTAINRMLAEDAEMEAQQQQQQQQQATAAGRSRKMSVANLAMAFESSFSNNGDSMGDTSDPDFIPGFRGTRRMTAINRMLAEDAEMEAQQQGAKPLGNRGRSRPSVANMAKAFESSFSSAGDRDIMEDTSDPDFIPGFRGARRMTAINRMLAEDAEMEAAAQTAQQQEGDDFIPGFRGTRRMTAINRMLAEDAEMESQEKARQEATTTGTAAVPKRPAGRGRARSSVANLAMAFEAKSLGMDMSDSSAGERREVEDKIEPAVIPGMRGTRRMTAINRALEEDAEMATLESLGMDLSEHHPSSHRVSNSNRRSGSRGAKRVSMADDLEMETLESLGMDLSEHQPSQHRDKDRKSLVRFSFAGVGESTATNASDDFTSSFHHASSHSLRFSAVMEDLEEHENEDDSSSSSSSDCSMASELSEDNNDLDFVPGFRGERRLTAIDRMLEEDAEMEAQERAAQEAAAARPKPGNKGRSRLSVANMAMAFESSLSSIGEHNVEDNAAAEPEFIPGFRGARRMTAINRMLAEDAEKEAQDRAREEKAKEEKPTPVKVKVVGGKTSSVGMKKAPKPRVVATKPRVVASKPRIVSVNATPSPAEEKTNEKASSLTPAEQIKARIAAKKKAMHSAKPKVAAEAPKAVKVRTSGSPVRSRKSVINIAMAFEGRKGDSSDDHHDGETVETMTEDTTVSADDRSCHSCDEEPEVPVASIKRRMTAINRALAEDAQEEARQEAMERSRREAAEARAAAKRARGAAGTTKSSENKNSSTAKKPAQRRNTAINLAMAIEAEEKSRKEAQERSRREAAEARAAARRARQQQQRVL